MPLCSLEQDGGGNTTTPEPLCTEAETDGVEWEMGENAPDVVLEITSTFIAGEIGTDWQPMLWRLL